MKLRTHIHLIVACLGVLVLGLMTSVELDRTRRAVSEEMTATNLVASQLLGFAVEGYAYQGPASLLQFLERLGRVRAQEIALVDASGATLYRSPAATYKAGREAPRWFAALLEPNIPTREYALRDGARLVLATNASRAILDGWDDLVELVVAAVAVLVLLNGLSFYFVNRALAPLPAIADGLTRLQRGDLRHRLPAFPGEEARIIGRAFNDMALAVEQKVSAERQARDAEAQLEERRELSRLIEERIEEERRMIARELHDEFAQSVTAIRSLALAIVAQTDSNASDAAQLISMEAARLYDAMHGLIPRLAPLTLDTLGLAETLASFVDEWRKRHPMVTVELRQNAPPGLAPSVALTIYRIVQEALNNAVRHGRPKRITVAIDCDAERAIVCIVDDGVGLAEDWRRPGRFGLRGLRERVGNLHGSLRVGNRAEGGVELRADIPLGGHA